MIYDIADKTCMILEEDGNKTWSCVSLYEDHNICDGDIDITGLEIYEVPNPYFLSDIFVFCKKHYDNVFLSGTADIVPYIKLNSGYQIEEIGTDFMARFGAYKFEDIIKRDDVKKASGLRKMIFSLIGDELWLKLRRNVR